MVLLFFPVLSNHCTVFDSNLLTICQLHFKLDQAEPCASDVSPVSLKWNRPGLQPYFNKRKVHYQRPVMFQKDSWQMRLCKLKGHRFVLPEVKRKAYICMLNSSKLPMEKLNAGQDN